MPNNLAVFKSVLLIEMDNLVEAIQQLMAASDEKYKKHAVSYKVLMENTAFFQKEILGINRFHQCVTNYDITEMRDEEDMARILKERFAAWVKSHDMPPALIPLVNLKIDKVLRYVNQGKETEKGSNT